MSKSKPYWKTKKFIELKKKWDKILLEDPEHRELEYYDKRGQPMNRFRYGSTADLAKRYSPDKQRHFELASQFWWDLKEAGADKITLAIWEMYSEGMMNKQIVEALELDPKFVKDTVARLRKQMLSRPKHMGLVLSEILQREGISWNALHKARGLQGQPGSAPYHTDMKVSTLQDTCRALEKLTGKRYTLDIVEAWEYAG